jgi:hypothetical protein
VERQAAPRAPEVCDAESLMAEAQSNQRFGNVVEHTLRTTAVPSVRIELAGAIKRESTELAFGDNPVVRTYRLSEAGRIERVERMKRMNADPVFAARRDAVSGERMKRLHADPVFAAKQAAAASEAMKRVNADPVLAARKAAARRIRTKAIIAALSVDPSATRVAKQTGVVPRTVARIAKAAGVKLTRGRPRGNRPGPA